MEVVKELYHMGDGPYPEREEMNQSELVCVWASYRDRKTSPTRVGAGVQVNNVT